MAQHQSTRAHSRKHPSIRGGLRRALQDHCRRGAQAATGWPLSARSVRLSGLRTKTESPSDVSSQGAPPGLRPRGDERLSAASTGPWAAGALGPRSQPRVKRLRFKREHPEHGLGGGQVRVADGRRERLRTGRTVVQQVTEHGCIPLGAGSGPRGMQPASARPQRGHPPTAGGTSGRSSSAHYARRA